MAKLYFRYGAMGSSKTANALMVRYNYQERGKQVILLKPRTDRRDGERVLASRIGLSAECEFVEEFESRVRTDWPQREADWRGLSAVIVDECQFLTESQAEFLAEVVDAYGISVICYGLLTDFTGRLFDGSRRLVELADVLEEIPTICWCGKKARMNARIQDGKVVRTGDQILMGGNETYIPLCRKHYREGRLGET